MADQTEKKTLEQITQDVLNSQFGITDADLSLLFADTSTDKAPAPTATPTTPSEGTATAPAPATEPKPAPAPAAQEPAATPPATPSTPAATTPSVTPPEPNRPDSALAKTQDLESTLKAQQEQIAQLQLMLQEMAKRAQPPSAPTPQPDPLADIDDQAIIEKPKETIVKLVQGILKTTLPAAFTEYDAQLTKRQVFEEFRRNHPDFDELRPIMRQIVLENPAANDDMSALPRVYQEAKNRKAAMLEMMRKELNIPMTSPAQPAQPAVSEEDVLSKLEQRIIEKIRQRKAASAASSPSSTPVSPVDRMTQTPKELPKSEDDLMFEAMLKAGVPSRGFLKDVETTPARK